jgi:glucokinase
MTGYLALDVGGSHIACARVVDGRIEQRVHIPITSSEWFLPLLPRLGAVMEEVRTSSVIGVAMAFPGLIEPRSGRILSTPAGKYEDAVGYDFYGWFGDRLGLPAKIEVDGRMALLGERAFGALQGQDDAVLLGLGTGIGSAAIMGGAIVRGRCGQASVLGGHCSIDAAGPPCRCGNIGCAEAVASTWALPRLIAALPARGALHDTPEPDLKTVFDLARSGDTGAAIVRDICLRTWAAAALNLVHAYDAACVVITGGAAEAPEVVPFIAEHVRRHAWSLGDAPSVVRGALGADAALLGAAPLWESDRDSV